MEAATNSALLSNIPHFVFDGTIALVGIIVSAFLGALFSGLINNYFESRRRLKEKRTDKYFEHRNSIVQLEHELIPIRLNTSRNLAALEDAISNTNPTNIRFILRFYKLSLSSGLNQKFVSLDFINSYSQLYSAIEIFNSDIQYVEGLVYSVRENMKEGKVDDSLNASYKKFLPHIKNECQEIDKKTFELLSKSKLAIGQEDEKIKKKYTEDGKEIKYTFNKKAMDKKNKEIEKEEDFNSHPNEPRPQFISPFLDLKKVRVA